MVTWRSTTGNNCHGRLTVDPFTAVVGQIQVKPPLVDWTRPRSCRWWAATETRYGAVMAVQVAGANVRPDWNDLDDVARAVAGALQENRHPESLWISMTSGRWSVTKAEHLPAMVTAMAERQQLDRLLVRRAPDWRNCGHKRCSRLTNPLFASLR
jgi:hypothetical protein